MILHKISIQNIKDKKTTPREPKVKKWSPKVRKSEAKWAKRPPKKKSKIETKFGRPHYVIALKRALRSILSISPCCLVSNAHSLRFALPSFGLLFDCLQWFPLSSRACFGLDIRCLVSVVFWLRFALPVSGLFWLRSVLPGFGFKIASKV